MINQLKNIFLVAIITLLIITSPLLCDDQNIKSHFWQLGAGCYGGLSGPEDGWSHLTDLDKARLDWVMICLGNERASPHVYNRQLKYNPDLKYLVRLWPVGNLAHSGKSSFLHFLYTPGVKEQLFKEVTDQIHSILDVIDKPENVLGFTFLEELPFHFAGELVIVEEEKLLKMMEPYKSYYKVERDKSLDTFESIRIWLGQKFVQAMNEIHQHIKKESQGRYVFLWLQANHKIMDYYPKDIDFKKKSLLPFYLKEIIKPGFCDGFFAYPNGQKVWDRHVKLAQENNWLFFSQLSHSARMRTCSWEQAVQLVEMNIPQNLGYFLFCVGDCRTDDWNDDPAIEIDNSIFRASVLSHLRRHMAQRNVGKDVLKKYLVPQIQLLYDSETTKINSHMPIRVLIHNTRSNSWYLHDEENILRNVAIKIELPIGFGSKGTTIEEKIGNLKANQYTSVLFYPFKTSDIIVNETNPIRITVSADNCPSSAFLETTPKSDIEPEPVHQVKSSGQRWIYPGYHLAGNIRPTVIIECIGDPATNPILTINNSKIKWKGYLQLGQKLVISPERTALLIDKDNLDGVDVTSQLSYRGVILEKERLNYITYHDEDPQSLNYKLKISILEKQE